MSDIVITACSAASKWTNNVLGSFRLPLLATVVGVLSHFANRRVRHSYHCKIWTIKKKQYQLLLDSVSTKQTIISFKKLYVLQDNCVGSLYSLYIYRYVLRYSVLLWGWSMALHMFYILPMILLLIMSLGWQHV